MVVVLSETSVLVLPESVRANNKSGTTAGNGDSARGSGVRRRLAGEGAERGVR